MSPTKLDWQRMEKTYPNGQVEILERARITTGLWAVVSSWDGGHTWTASNPATAKSRQWTSLAEAKERAVSRRIEHLKLMAVEYENAMAVLLPELKRLKAERKVAAV